MTIPAEIEEKIYDEYMRIHKVERIPIRVTDAIDYLNKHSVMYAEKVPKKGIDIEQYCFGVVCFDTLDHRNKFYREYPDVAFILEKIGEEHEFTYRYVKFDILTCCTSGTFEKEGIMIWRYIHDVSKAVAGFFENSLSEWAVETALDVWDEICPSECAKIGGTVEAITCPDEKERGFDNGVFIVSYAEVDYKKNVIERWSCSDEDRPDIYGGKNVYTGSTTQDRWNRT